MRTNLINNAKWLLAVALAVISAQLWATDVTFTAGTDDTSEGKSGVTITMSVDDSNPYKIYKSSNAVFTAPSGYNITKIVFTCTKEDDAQYGPGSFGDGAPATYTYSSYTGTWTGSAATVTFTASDNQVRCTSIVVTIQASVTYAVTWKSDGVTVHTDAAVPSGTTVSVPSTPSVPSGCAGGVFMGWTATENYSGNSAPGDLFTSTSPAITAATTFYAVFADPE